MAQCYCKILRGPTPAKINILLLHGEKARGRGNVISKIRNSFVTSIFVSRPSLNDTDVAVDGAFDRMTTDSFYEGGRCKAQVLYHESRTSGSKKVAKVEC